MSGLVVGSRTSHHSGAAVVTLPPRLGSLDENYDHDGPARPAVAPYVGARQAGPFRVSVLSRDDGPPDSP